MFLIQLPHLFVGEIMPRHQDDNGLAWIGQHVFHCGLADLGGLEGAGWRNHKRHAIS